jgi:uncharacterized protein YbjQ (UPF0145 family)
MGAEASTLKTGGALLGAYAPPLTGVPLPNPTPSYKTFKADVPADKTGGQKMSVSIKGEKITIDIPKGKRPGESFQFKVVASSSHVITSTLPTVPGMVIYQSKPIIWGSVSHSYSAGGRANGQQSMGHVVGKLMQEAQSEIMEQAVLADCNAVLGMTYNVTNDSSGERGNFKVVIVTVCGTPCIVVPATEQPVVEASVIVEPLYNS